jgi:tRNA U34 5-methylaminomethyl-2-thiouridine-forming methyltransferase MnmC
LKNRFVTKTKDNTTTLFVPELDEHYHSIHGALQESKHVFIQAGLHPLKTQETVRILEIGFGTGLNALLTAQETTASNQNIEYTSLEKYPVTANEVEQLNFQELIPDNETLTLLNALHTSDWEVEQKISSNFTLVKHQNDLKTFDFKPNYYDLIYFDAFAPSAQPELWSETIFQKMYACLRNNGVLVTYCVKGDVRRNMKAVGFKVEKIPGPPGKREMARAYKMLEDDSK